MKTYKLAITGVMVVEVEAESIEDAEELFWDSPAHENSELFDTEILETVPADKPFERYTDCN
jgi:hypothetical protein